MSSITRIRNKSFEKWFTINLAIHDLPADVLSTDGKAFHTYLASKPDGWEYNRDHAIKIIGSGHKVDKAGAELKALGLLKVEKIREKGRFVGFDWKIETEMPDSIGDSPFPDIPDPVTPDPVIQDTLIEIPREEKKTLSEKLTPGARDPQTLPLPFADEQPAPKPKAKRTPKPKDPLMPKHDPEGFRQVCAQHPGTVDQAKAARQWDKLKPSTELVSTILHYQAERKGSGDWATQDPAYICHLHTFLRDYGWLVKWVKPSPQQRLGSAKTAQDDQAEIARFQYFKNLFSEGAEA